MHGIEPKVISSDGHNVWVAGLVLALSLPGNGAGPESITAVQRCDLGPCLLMEIDYEDRLIPKGTETGNGDTSYALPVNGRLSDVDAVSPFVLSVKAYTGGIECSNLGQASIAVQGIKQGHPWIKTSRGTLEVVDDRLQVGCKDCLRHVEKKSSRVRQTYTTPSWDLARLGIDSIYVNNHGEFYLKGQGGCFRLLTHGEYSKDDSKACLRDGLHPLQGAAHEITEGDKTFHRYDLPALPFYVDVVNQACT